jgi:polyvinyl alcohol dehydrogenase (cytochrome)
MRSLLLFVLGASTALGQDGASVYKAHCAMCHDAGGGRIPPVSALRAMSSSSILRALDTGLMKTQAADLTQGERDAVAKYLGSPSLKPVAALPASAFCSAKAKGLPVDLESRRWRGWGGDTVNTRFADSATAGITAADVPKLKLKWAFGLGDGTSVRSQVAAGGGRVYAANLTGQVYSLDAESGCIQWTFDAGAPVRSPITLGSADGAGKRVAIYFGDQAAHAYSVDASTGKLLWEVATSDHPAAMITGGAQLHDGVVYVPVSSYEEVLAAIPTYECCSFRGSVVALDAVSGKTIWKTDTIAEAAQPTEKSKTGTQLRGPSGAAVWSSPTFDEKLNVLYISTGDNYSTPSSKTSDAVLALDAKTGKVLWVKQVTSDDVFNEGPLISGRDFDFGQPPILVGLANGRRALVLGQKSGIASALDPDREGEILWQTRLGKGGALGGIEWGSAADGQNMYAAVSDQTVTGIPDKSSPIGYRLVLDPSRGGGLFALSLSSGDKVWSANPPSCGDRKQCSPAQSAAVTVIQGAVCSGSVDGHLRAYSASTGEVIWDVDTAREYETVNGQKAKGGSLDVAGPVVSHGMVYVNSGYGQWGGMPGNVLLAFSVDGK